MSRVLYNVFISDEVDVALRFFFLFIIFFILKDSYLFSWTPPAKTELQKKKKKKCMTWFTGPRILF